MSPKDLKRFKKKLEDKKQELEESLSSFATKDPKLAGDWDSKFPEFGDDPNVNLEEAADEVEEYIARLPVEHSYELRVQDINGALARIKKDKYGTCINCNKKIPRKRLEAYPEAKFCLNCEKQQSQQ